MSTNNGKITIYNKRAYWIRGEHGSGEGLAKEMKVLEEAVAKVDKDLRKN